LRQQQNDDVRGSHKTRTAVENVAMGYKGAPGVSSANRKPRDYWRNIAITTNNQVVQMRLSGVSISRSVRKSSSRADQAVQSCREGPSLRSGFRQRAPASLTPAKRLNLGCEGSAVQICPSRPIFLESQLVPDFINYQMKLDGGC